MNMFVRLAMPAAIAVALATAAFAADLPPDRLAPVAALAGDWTGVGEGEPGTSAATRHTGRRHHGHYIVVEGRSVYPKQPKNKKGETHTSTDIWSFDTARGALILRSFDSLGFVSTYVEDKSARRPGHIVLVSEHLENVPAGWKARYTYDFPSADEYHELFELDPDGKGFQLYVLGKYLRDKAD